MKTCSQCGAEKPLSEFYMYGPRKQKLNVTHFAECKECQRSRARTWQRTRRAADPTYKRRARLRALYHISLEQYEVLLAEQGGGCAICRSADPRTGKDGLFPVDHDHKTGEVRGLLCQPCNTGLGGFRDDVELLAAAVAYLGGASASLSGDQFFSDLKNYIRIHGGSGPNAVQRALGQVF